MENNFSTKKFKTRTYAIPRDNGSLSGVWEVALDIGYSAVKGFSPNMVYSFPSYARRSTDSDYLGSLSEAFILYKDNETGEMWTVGEIAQSQISMLDTNDTEETLYGRSRYGNPMFKVLARVGIGLGMRTNKHGSPQGKRLALQTGLPPKYLKSDTPFLKNALAGHHNFSLKVGNADWVDFEFDLQDDAIYVMPQPLGTLISISVTSTGRSVPDANKYLNSKVIVFDPGFGTLDIFPIENHATGASQTFNDLGMRRVLSETAKLIEDEFGMEVPVPAMQESLGSGTMVVGDRIKRISKQIEIAPYLQKANEKVCNEALDRLEALFDLLSTKYLVIAGGTGAAWDDIIRERYSGYSGLCIISSTQNDELPAIFSNVRGYYFYRYNKLKKEDYGLV